MATIAYIERSFKESTLAMISHAIQILDDYAAQGYIVTVRQLYYRFIALDLFPEDRKWRLTDSGKWVRDPNGTKNAAPNYKWLLNITSDARLAGYIDWDMIEDRTRELEEENAWDDPLQIMQASADQYHMNRWNNQEYRPEVWIEKEALEGIIEKICKKLDVSYIACKGYMSQSAMWVASQRMIKHIDDGYKSIIFHLGDHDPSGLDMSEDIKKRLDLFLEYDGYRYDENWELIRIALNMDQIKEYNPPPQPAKPGDSRTREYEAQYGPDCWELDSMEPSDMNALIEREIRELIDTTKWGEIENKEADHRKAMQKAIKEMKI